MGDVVRFPAFCDVHVHFREPGFEQKETIATGCAAAARGGYTTVCTMPNLNPVSDSVEHIALQQRAIDRTASIQVLPYAAITCAEAGAKLTDMEALAPHCFAFSDDGKGVQSAEMMRQAMKRARALGKVVAAHCEDERLLFGGYVNDGPYAAAYGHAGICAESEWGPIERDLQLAAETGCAYHVCHVSTARSVQAIRRAKAAGVDVTCETAPHYLLLDETFLEEDGRFKMNPPLRLPSDREALIEGIVDGTIDMVSTDHAPHTSQEKARGLAKSPFGVVGLETAFPLLYTYMVETGIVSMERLVDLLAVNARKRFGLPLPNMQDTFCEWDLGVEYTIDPNEFASMGRATPFAGWTVRGRCVRTVLDGRTVYSLRDARDAMGTRDAEGAEGAAGARDAEGATDATDTQNAQGVQNAKEERR